VAGLDPRDPRSREQDEIPRLPPPPVPPPQRSEEELTERYGPPAPEPQWGKVRPPFNRERFLLYCVAWIIGVQYAIFIMGGVMCSYLTSIIIKAEVAGNPKPPRSLPFCLNLSDKMHESAAASLSVLLALLGGGAVAVGEYQRRQGGRDPRDPG
jgi:hypothetical protein